MFGTLIFGGTGSLGRKLIERWLPKGEFISVYSRDEAKHWTLKNEVASGPLSTTFEQLRFFVGDVRDSIRVRDVIRQIKPERIIIAAALKQVDTCELSPSESVLTNLIGTQNVVDAINDLQHKCTVLFVSTDKACSPVNVYGMCKAISERIITSQAMVSDIAKFLVVRYGNVLESRGSIIPLFKYQGEHGEALTVTDPDMTRYLMTLDDSVNLIENALDSGHSGETWIPRLPSMRIGDLAKIFSSKYEKPIKIIGLRPGEKKHEDLINESESVRTWLSHDRKHHIISPVFKNGNSVRFTYSSSDSVMSAYELELHLNQLGILDAPLSDFKGAGIEEIATNNKDTP